MKKFLVYITLFIIFIIFITSIPNSHNLTPPSIMSKNSINSISVLTANVGNLSLGCRSVLNNLCYKETEQRIANNLKNLQPDIVALQEILAPWQCEQIEENNTKKVCNDKQTIPQIRRLVGRDYSIACTSREQFECIAVHTSIGKIENCPLGELCSTARTGVDIPECDNGFSVSAITIELNNGFKFDVVNTHPQSTDTACRTQMISLIFDSQDNTPPLIKEKNVLIMGDFNLDPWRDNDESVEAWQRYFAQGWAGKNFQYHSDIAKANPPNFTSFFLLKKRTFDFIVSNFATGICQVLGETPETARLDGGKGTDHRAVFGILFIAP